MIREAAKANPNFFPEFTEKTQKNGAKSGKFAFFRG